MSVLMTLYQRGIILVGSLAVVGLVIWSPKVCEYSGTPKRSVAVGRISVGAHCEYLSPGRMLYSRDGVRLGPGNRFTGDTPARYWSVHLDAARLLLEAGAGVIVTLALALFVGGLPRRLGGSGSE